MSEPVRVIPLDGVDGDHAQIPRAYVFEDEHGRFAGAVSLTDSQLSALCAARSEGSGASA